MEVTRKRNQATKIVFPLINASSTSAYYTTSAWTSMTNATKTVYFWSDDASAPTSATIAANPTQLASTGEWYLVISASEISAVSQYMSIKLKSDQILEQTILVRITNYDASNVFTSSDLINGNSTSVTVSAYQNFPQVSVSAQTNHPAVTVSAYTNFPQVTVSANLDKTNYTVSSGSITAVAGNVTGSVASVTNPVSVNSIASGIYVGTSAYTNFPQVYVSAGQVTNVTGNISGSVNSVSTSVTAVSVTNPVTVGTNNDKINYTVSSGSITAVAGNVTGSVASVTNPVSVNSIAGGVYVGTSAYTNFPQVQVSGVNGGLFIGTSAYTNFPSVNVSSVTDGSITSADFATDYWNRVGIGTPVSLNGGTATIAGMLQQIADGSTGSTFVSANSLKGIYDQVITNNAASLTANGGSVLGGANLSGSYLNTSAADANYWRIQTSGTVPLSATLTFNLGTRVPSTVTIAGYLNAGSPTGSGRVDVYAYNYTTSAYTLLTNASTAILNGTSNSTYSYVLNASTNVNSVGAAQLLFVAARLNTSDILLLDYVTMNAVAAGTSVTDIANAVYNKMGLVVYDNGVWIDTVSGYSGTVLGTNGISTYPSNNLADALNIAQQINLKRFYLKPDSSIVLLSAYDAWRFIGRGNIGLNGQSIADATFENSQWISGTSVGKDYVMDDCALGNITLDSGNIHNSEFNGTFTTCANGVYVFKRCIDANPAGLASPTFVCAPSATMAFRDWRGGIQFNNMVSSNSIKLDGMGRVVIDSSCSGGDLTLRGFWQVTNNGTGVIITSSARYDNTTPVTVSAYQNFPQVFVSAGTVNNITNSVSVSAQTNHPAVTVSAYTNFPQIQVSGINGGLFVGTSAYTNFPQVYASAGNFTNFTGNISGSVASVTGAVASVTNPVTVGTNNDKTGYTVTAGTIGNVTNPVSVSAYTNFPQVYVSAGQVTNVTGNVSGSVNSVVGNVGGNVVGSVASVTNPVSVNSIAGGVYVGTSAYTNFPQVYVSAGQVTNVTGNVSGSVNNVVVPQSVTVGSVNVSSVDSGAITSSDFNSDVYNQINVVLTSNHGEGSWQSTSGSSVISANVVQWKGLTPNDLVGGKVDANATATVSVGSVNVSSVDGGVFVGTSAYTNFPQVTVSANLDKTNYTVSSGSITTVTGNVNGSVASVTNPVSVNSIAGGVYVGTSAYTNFPQVYVSAGQVTNVTGNISGSVNSVVGGVTVTTNNDKTGYSVTAQTNHPTVAVSAYSNFPQVYVSAGTVTASSVTDKTGYSITANTDKTGYSLAGSVVVSAYTNFPQVTVSANLDKTGYAITANTDKTGYSLSGPVSVSAYQNFPQVYVSAGTVTASSVTDKTGYSITANTDKTNYTLTSADKVILVSAVWDEILQGSTHNIIKSAGKRLRDLGSSVITEEFLPSQSGLGLNQVRLDGLASPIDGSYDPAMITIIEGTGSGQTRLIYEYDGTTKIATLDRNWKIIPDQTSYYQILSNPGREHINEGAIRGSTNNTVTLNTLASSADDTYIGQLIFIRSGIGEDQVGLIIDYNGTNKIATLSENWFTNPVSGDGYVILPNHIHDTYTSAMYSTNYWDKISSLETTAVTVTGYQNFPQVYVSAGQVTNVTGNVSGSVNSVVGSVGSVTGNIGGSVNSVTNPVTVGTNNDKTNYTVSSGTITTVTNPVDMNGSVSVSAYYNFPSVNVSSVSNNAITSASFDNDYWNKVQSFDTVVTIGKVQVSGIDGGVYVGTSAYTNFPQVYVSAVAPGVEISATVIIDYNRIMSAAISAIDERFTFTSGGDLIVDTDSIVNAIMAATIDTKTFEQVIEILLAMATGRITRSNNQFTYYKQDNTTSLFTLESERNERTKL